MNIKEGKLYSLNKCEMLKDKIKKKNSLNPKLKKKIIGGRTHKLKKWKVSRNLKVTKKIS